MTIAPCLGDVRPVDPTVPHDSPMTEPASDWEVYTSQGWVNLGAVMDETYVVEAPAMANLPGSAMPAMDGMDVWRILLT